MAAFSSNDAPTSTPATGSQTSQKITEYGPDSVTPVADQQNQRAENLPGAERPDGEVNWLGSSFSGVDIKVVAHLYGSVDVDRELADLQAQYDLYVQISDACSQVASSVSNVNLQFLLEGNSGVVEDNILRLAGLFPQDASNQSAGDFILEVFRNTPRGPIFVSALTQRMDDFRTLYGRMADDVRSKLEKRQELVKKSSTTVVLATLQTLSIQTFREKMAVRALGASYVKGYTRGPRTIAGSMIFTMFNEHALAKLIRSMAGRGSIYGERDTELSSLIADQLPPLDLTIIIANEYGQLSRQGLYGVEFVSDGTTMSVEDILTEEVCQFVARDCDVLTSQGNIRLMGNQRGMHFKEDGTADTSGSSLLFTSQDTYQEFIDKLKVRRRLLNR